MTNNKQLYQQFCEKEKGLPLFLCYNWYQEIYADDWEVVVEEQGGVLVGFMPYVLKKKKGFKIILPEPLIPYQGIWISYPKNISDPAKLRLEKKVITSLIKKLPEVDLFEQQFHPLFTNWLPFYWEGFNQTTRYTYVLPDISDLEKVFSAFKDTTRNKIKKAEKNLQVIESKDVSSFYELKLKDYQVKGKKYKISQERLKKVMNYAISANKGEILTACDENKKVHAMLFYMWDDKSAYFVHSVSAIDSQISGAMSFLLWEAIKRASLKTLAFDFEGSMVEPLEQYFRSFGTVQQPYFQISKTDSKVLKLLNY